MHTHAISPAPFFTLDCPLESIPGERQMRIANLGAFPELARGFGVDPTSFLKRHEIDPAKIQCPDSLIDCKAFTELLEDCSESFRAPLLGLKLAQLQEPDVYGCVIALCRSASTVREAIESFVKYIRVTHSSASVQELLVSDTTAELRWYVNADLGCNRQANYHAALLIMKLLRQIGGQRFRANGVTLAIDTQHKDIAAVEKYFACRFHSNTAINAIAFPREFLDQNLASASRLLFTLLSGYLDRVKASSSTSLEQQIKNYIRSALPSGQCSTHQCAQRLGMAVRTLQTKLSEAGLEFSKILEEQRMELAKMYLKTEYLPLFEIAANLGYAEQSSFIRAFKRWTGCTPRQYRHQLQ